VTSKTLLMSGLLAATALLAILPQPAAAFETSIDPCQTLNCEIQAPPPICEIDVGRPIDSDPTSVTCVTGQVCGCACPVVGSTFHAEAGGQEVDGWVASVILPFCGVGGSGTLTPGPIDPSAPAEVCDTVWSWPTGLIATLCAHADPGAGCAGVGVGTNPILAIDWTGPPIVSPVPVNVGNVCASAACSVQNPGYGGVIGDTLDYASAMDGIACDLVAAELAVANQAAADTEAYVAEQLTDTSDWMCDNFCMTMMASICNMECIVNGAVPQWARDYVDAARATALSEANGQFGAACAFVLGPYVCISDPGPAGACPVAGPGGLGGVVGDTVTYAETACAMAEGGAIQLAGATTAAAGAAEQWTEDKVDQAQDEARRLLLAVRVYVTGRTADATAYAAAMAGNADDAVTAALLAGNQTCYATMDFVGGSGCPVAL